MRALQGLWLLLAVFVLSGCDGAIGSDGATADETPDYRYRLTVEVETPEGLKTGSSVIEVETNRASKFAIPTPGYVSHRLRGEAVAVDLGDDRTLFALLRSENSVDWATNIMFLMAPEGTTDDGDAFLGRFHNMLAMKGEIELRFVKAVAKGALQLDGYPMLVTFGDLDDPTSIVRVDPRDMAATFGEGVSLKRITVQMTSDPVTTGIEERLAWFQDVAASGGGFIPMVKNELGRYEAAAGYDVSLVDLGVSNFSTEAYK